MFKVNNENTRTTSMTRFSTVSIVYFEQVKVSWVTTTLVQCTSPWGGFLK